MSNLRIAFMGTPDFSCTVLKALLQSDHEVVCVYSQPPRKAGRGKTLRPTPVHQLAAENKLQVRTPTSLKSTEIQAEFAALNVDVAIVVAYGLLLPKSILDAPKFGCLNLHASLLPRWRGAAPIQRAIMAGDTETGVGIPSPQSDGWQCHSRGPRVCRVDPSRPRPAGGCRPLTH
ncbi:MAG: hypothetical protein JKY04_07840, partial [Sneathiella sp.]|nr:hypothetical protein [Sneathiella sp.]